MKWASANPRIANALSRWAAVVERETPRAVQETVRQLVQLNLQSWEGEQMPLSRSWVDSEVESLTGRDRAIARLALVIAKAPFQVDDALVEDMINGERDEARLNRILAWASFSAARRFAQRIAEAAGRPSSAWIRPIQ